MPNAVQGFQYALELLAQDCPEELVVRRRRHGSSY
jgi:hypothetical protein